MLLSETLQAHLAEKLEHSMKANVKAKVSWQPTTGTKD